MQTMWIFKWVCEFVFDVNTYKKMIVYWHSCSTYALDMQFMFVAYTSHTTHPHTHTNEHPSQEMALVRNLVLRRARNAVKYCTLRMKQIKILNPIVCSVCLCNNNLECMPKHHIHCICSFCLFFLSKELHFCHLCLQNNLFLFMKKKRRVFARSATWKVQYTYKYCDHSNIQSKLMKENSMTQKVMMKKQCFFSFFSFRFFFSFSYVKL